MQVSGYLGTLEKSQKIILKINVPEASARPKRGHRAASTTGIHQFAMGEPLCRLFFIGADGKEAICRLVTYLTPYILFHQGNSGTEVAFSIYAAELPQTLYSSSES